MNTQPTSTSRLRRVAPGLAVPALLALAACGSGATDASDGADEVASLEATDEPAGEAGDGGDDGDTTLAADEAALEFSQCLRDEGLDVPDIGVDADGNIALRDAFQDINPRDGEFQDAFEVCGDLLEGVQFGGGRGALQDDTEFQDALIEMSDCIREQGFEDVGDLTVPQPGQDGAPGGPAGGGQGQGQGGFGDRGAIVAERLGLDPEDPEVIAAVDDCLPILDTALSDAGVPVGGGQGDG